MKWLFVTTRFPWPITHGSWLRVYHLACAMAGQSQSASVLSYPPTDEAARQYERDGVAVLAGPAGPPPVRGPARCWGGPCVFSPELAARLGEAAADFDVVVLVREMALQYAPEARRAGVVIMDMVDDPVLEMQRQARIRHPHTWRPRTWPGALRQRRYERKFVHLLDGVTVVSPEDRDGFAGRNRGARVAVIRNSVKGDYFRPSGLAVASPPRVVFTGNMTFAPNQDAAEFLLDQIAPLVWRRRADVCFAVVGMNPSLRLLARRSPRVDVTGYVEDMRPLLETAAVVSAPMRMGTGIKNKILEAWAMGAAVVATPLACQGLDATDGRNLLVAGTASDQADAIIRLIEDVPLRERISAGARSAVEPDLDWAAKARMLSEFAAGLRRQK